MEENLPEQPSQPNESFDVPAPKQAEGLILSEDAQYYLLIAGKWARFLGIMGFIGTAFVAIMALFMGAFMSAMSQFSPAARAGFPTGLFSVIYIIIAVFYFFASMYLYQFGVKVKEGVNFGSAEYVTDGLGKLKSLFKLLGITTIVVLSLYILIIIGVVIFASQMAHNSTSMY